MEQELIDCDICYLPKFKSELVFLKCCKNDNLCKSCFEIMCRSTCPFCRSNFPKRLRSNTISSIENDDSNIISCLDTHVESFDDISVYSKIYRRKRKQFLKLREREILKFRNKILNKQKKDKK